MDSSFTYIISDLHLGSKYSHTTAFISWLDALPDCAGLVLNGDIVDDPGQTLGQVGRAVLGRLVEESQRRQVVWVRGNHDASFVTNQPGQIQFVSEWRIDRRLLVVHGDDFDRVMPRHMLFKQLFRGVHDLRLWLGFPDVDVAHYAKAWPFLYRVLNQHVALNALRAATSQGFQAVACGHTHAAMDIERIGVRYINSGAWTEEPLHYILVDPEKIALCVYSGPLP